MVDDKLSVSELMTTSLIALPPVVPVRRLVDALRMCAHQAFPVTPEVEKALGDTGARGRRRGLWRREKRCGLRAPVPGGRAGLASAHGTNGLTPTVGACAPQPCPLARPRSTPQRPSPDDPCRRALRAARRHPAVHPAAPAALAARPGGPTAGRHAAGAPGGGRRPQQRRRRRAGPGAGGVGQGRRQRRLRGGGGGAAARVSWRAGGWGGRAGAAGGRDQHGAAPAAAAAALPLHGCPCRPAACLALSDVLFRCPARLPRLAQRAAARAPLAGGAAAGAGGDGADTSQGG